MAENTGGLDPIVKTIQLVAVVVGVVISVLSFNATRQQETVARELELAKPFLELRQSLYMEALKAAGVLANPTVHSPQELGMARKRFRQLYVAELSMVEPESVEGTMKKLAREIDEELLSFTPAQRATYNLAHALRDTFTDSWKVQK